MKIFRILMLAFLGLAGYVGAVKSASANQTGSLYHKTPAGVYELLDPEQQGGNPGQWNCILPTQDVTCTYRRISQDEPISDTNAERNESGMFVQF